MKKWCLTLLVSFGAGVLGLSSAHAQSSLWQTISASNKKDAIAYTVGKDDSKQILAVRCFQDSKKCAVVLSMSTQCEDKAFYPMLINSDSGALHIRGFCTVNEGRYEYILSPYEQVSQILYSGKGTLGIATPLDDGAFRAYRFNLYGAKEAMDVIYSKIRDRDGTTSSYKF
jgi:hypothetical protein